MAVFGDFLMIKMKILDANGEVLEEGNEQGDLYIYGLNSILPVVDGEVARMAEGEEKTIEVKPEQGYGPRSDELIRTFPLKQFKEKPVEGELIEMQAGGNTYRGRVLKVEGGRVTIDFNHPYAGKTLKFNVKVEKIGKDEKSKIEFLLKQFQVKGEIKGKVVEVSDEEKYRGLLPTFSYLFPEYELKLKK